MFDGVPEQFHQFIASRNSVPLPLSFPLHASTQTFSTFDPFPSHQTVLQLQPHLLPQLHHPSPTHKEEEKVQVNGLLSTSSQLERERSMPERIDPWSNDEVLALLRIRSSMENLFLDFTWEHVSRKLAELGFKRSAEKCREKFEEESRHFNSMTYSKNFRFFSELEELCHGDNPQVLAEKNQNVGRLPNEEVEKVGQISLDEYSRNETVGKSNSSQENEKIPKDKKRKRHRQFEMLRGFCEEIVNKMIAQQEEMNNKLIEDIVKRDEEKIAREEAWKKQEIERINKEIEIRAHEQAIAGDRQTKLIEFLKKFISNSSENQSPGSRNENVLEVPNGSFSLTSLSFIQPHNPSPMCQPSTQNKHEAPTSSPMVTACENPSSLTTHNNSNVPTSSTESLVPQNPSSASATSGQKVSTSPILDLPFQNPTNTQNSTLPPTPASPTHKTPQNLNLTQNEREELGKRWPKEEVLELINLRCSLNSNGPEDKEGAKGPLWERISQGMLELGYKRSAKRCKEKWENINKYFRKTKDANKKRSLDSRTCPYFHQLSSLYSQGTLVAPLDGPENHSAAPKNHSAAPETCHGSPQGGSASDADMHVLKVGRI